MRLTIISSLFLAFGSSFFVPLSAKGRLKENAISIAISHILVIGIVYILFKTGHSPLSLAWALLIEEFFLCLLLKPYLLVKIVGYKWYELWQIFSPCIKVTLIAVPIPLIIFNVLNHFSLNEFTRFTINVPTSIFFVSISVWFFGLNSEIKDFIKQIIKKKKIDL